MSNILIRAYTAQVTQLIHTLVTVPLSLSLPHSISLRSLSPSFSHARAIQMHKRSLSKPEFQRQKRLEFFHSLPQTSSNLSFSLQWSNGDVCSSLVQLNFKKLSTHAQYHYCKHNYHKLSSLSVAPSVCDSSDLIHLQILIQRRCGKKRSGGVKVVW